MSDPAASGQASATTVPQHRWDVVRLSARHVDELVLIEHLSYTLPWSREMFLSELRRPDGRHLGVVDDQGRLQAYLVGSPYAEVWHIMNLAVHPAARRSGLARLLLERFLRDTADLPMRGYTLEVRVSNTAAIQLYEALGFSAFGRRRAYYIDNREDAVVMWKPPAGATQDWSPEA